MQIYLDHSATTPPHADVIALMQSVLADQWGNPSSLHDWGARAATVLERARLQVASLLNAPPETILFTSGGTESNNLAILGVTRQYATPQHIVISTVEHAAVSEPVRILEQQGWRVTRLPVDRLGRVDPGDLKAALASNASNTVLVSAIYGQSEVGTIQPIEALGQIARAHGALFHTDAVQVAGRLPIDLQTLPVDLLSISSHKLYGPQGSGALYLRSGVELVPLQAGGGQEFGCRSGTQALPNIAGFGLAAELAERDMSLELSRLSQLRDSLFDQLAEIEALVVTGDRWCRLPHHASFYLRSADGDQVSGKTLMRQMNLAGIGISSGSACNSGKLVPSAALLAMGYSERAAKSGIRLSLGRSTTQADIDWTVIVLKQVIERLSPKLVLC